MLVSPFVPQGHHLIINKTPEVSIEKITSEEIQSVIKKMMMIVENYREDNGNGVMVGLAAPQIGIPLSIIIVDMDVDANWKNLGKLSIYINPKITWYSEEVIYGIEGCYSVDSHLDGKIPRAQSIILEAYDSQGNFIKKPFSGFTARIFQHEVDHVNGICFPDRIGPNGCLHWIPDNQYNNYKEQWMSWPLNCPWEIWLKMKNNQPYQAPSSESFL